MAAAPKLEALLAQLSQQNAGISRISGMSSAESLGSSVFQQADVLAFGWPELDATLPDGGLPRGVVELTADRALGGMTSVAACAVRAAQAKDARAWCAWIDPEATLHAPGLAMAGIDLGRLLVVRPPRAVLGRIAVKMVAACAFDVIVIDMDRIAGTAPVSAKEPDSRARKSRPAVFRKPVSPEVLVRKLALLAEDGNARVLLLTDAQTPRSTPWPVALRLELSRTPEALALRVAKDRRGRVGPVKTVPLATRPMQDANTQRAG